MSWLPRAAPPAGLFSTFLLYGWGKFSFTRRGVMGYKSLVGEIIRSYADAGFHREIGVLIRKYSVNSTDIRGVVLKAMGTGEIGNLLDLGCGYGWFEEVLPDCAADLILGIDCLEENRNQFLQVARRVAGKALFETKQLPAPIGMPSGFFDVIVAAYSLYFFPEEIAEIRRLLGDGGRFVAITHSEAMLEEGERFFDFANLRQVINHFSAENGKALLGNHFSSVEAVDFPNALVFPESGREDLEKYIEFKKEFIVKDADPAVVKKTMVDELRHKGSVSFNKNDRIFIAGK
jgi:SAM-dependent methyltransferase